MAAAESVLANCISVCSQLVRHAPLQARLGAGCPAAQTLLRHAALQLLPLVVKVATQQLRTPDRPLDPATWHQLLKVLVDLHAWGLADLTASVGAPALLLRLVRSLRRDLPQAPSLLEMTTRVLDLADGSSPWLCQVARLAFLEALLACAASLQSSAAVGGDALPAWGSVLPYVVPAHSGGGGMAAGAADVPWVSCFLLNGQLDGIVARLRQRVEACLDSGGAASSAATWDGCALALLMEPPLQLHAGGCVRALLGCCHVRCTNLSGPSEAALRLRRCGGCRLAGYCSAACQRKAWRSGHRAACLDWQRISAELAVYDDE